MLKTTGLVCCHWSDHFYDWESRAVWLLPLRCLCPTLSVPPVAAELVTACYHAVNSMPVCKRVEFAINPITGPQQQHAKVLRTPMTALHQHAVTTVLTSVFTCVFVRVCVFSSLWWSQGPPGSPSAAKWLSTWTTHRICAKKSPLPLWKKVILDFLCSCWNRCCLAQLNSCLTQCAALPVCPQCAPRPC